MGQYIVDKVLNNNVLIALKNNKEVVLIGKGIGFNKKAGHPISDQDLNKIEKMLLSIIEKIENRDKLLIDLTKEIALLKLKIKQNHKL